jgi:hypothetical protein
MTFVFGMICGAALLVSIVLIWWCELWPFRRFDW